MTRLSAPVHHFRRGLLEGGTADSNATVLNTPEPDTGLTPLMLAVQLQLESCLDHVISLKPDGTPVSNENQSALQIAMNAVQQGNGLSGGGGGGEGGGVSPQQQQQADDAKRAGHAPCSREVGPGGNEEGAGAGRYCVNYAMARKIALTGAERPLLLLFLRSLCHQTFSSRHYFLCRLQTTISSCSLLSPLI